MFILFTSISTTDYYLIISIIIRKHFLIYIVIDKVYYSEYALYFYFHSIL